MGRALPALGAALLVLWAGAANASGASTVGATFTPSGGACTGNYFYLQTTSPNGSYAAPSGGVITSWSFLAPAASSPPTLRFKVGRPVGGPSYTIVGQSAAVPIAVNSLNTFASQIPVEAGDVIGLYLPMGASCFAGGAPGHQFSLHIGDVAPGQTESFSAGGPNLRLDVSAVLEPDADGDGFGDETQDTCPADETVQVGGCPVPETTITSSPKAKTKKTKSTFEFSSASAGATFECSLDGAAFAACSSPDTVTAKKGTHHFEVRATAKGQTDPTPAAFDWKVKKKKKKK